MTNEDCWIICAVFATVGLWKVAAALRAIAEAVKVAMSRNVNIRHQREREPWENN